MLWPARKRRYSDEPRRTVRQRCNFARPFQRPGQEGSRRRDRRRRGQGRDASVNGFGKFKARESAAREGRHPSTGPTIQSACFEDAWVFRPPRLVRTVSTAKLRSEEHTSELQSLLRISY